MNSVQAYIIFTGNVVYLFSRANELYQAARIIPAKIAAKTIINESHLLTRIFYKIKLPEYG
jgi:hypothetical protein